MLVLTFALFAQTGNPPEVDVPYYQEFLISSNGVSATATTNLTVNSNLWLRSGAERATFWASVQSDAGATSQVSKSQIYISPISIFRGGTNDTQTNICYWVESPIVLSMTPAGNTQVIKATNYDVAGIEGFVVTAVVNTTTNTLTNAVWMTYRPRPK